MSVSLLATKLHRPVPPSRLVQRPYLVQRLNEGLQAGCQLILISAPAGFGKSTCVIDWLNNQNLSAGWLSLDSSDDDPARFLAYFIAALQKVDPTIGVETSQQSDTPPQPGQISPIEPLFALLLNEIARSGQIVLLVLDDFHVIKNASILKAFEMMLANQPANLHLVLITREDPQLPLARLRASNRLTEIRADDLRFTVEETGCFLNALMGLNLSEADIAVLEERTEGWAAGLQLAALSMRGRTDRTDFIAHISGGHRYILSYLTEEVLNRQPDVVREFLLQTSFLDKLNADLCNVVTERIDSHALLEKLYFSNLFLIPLDDVAASGTGEGWFRYHHLFAELLQVHLRRAYAKERIAALHLRAAGWFEQNGDFSEAVEQATGFAAITGDFDLAARLVEENTTLLLVRGELMTLLRWMDALPAEIILQHSHLLLSKIWVLLFAGAIGQIQLLLQQVEVKFGEAPDTPEARKILGSAAAVRAFFTMMGGDHAGALALADRANVLLPADMSDPYLFAAHSVVPYSQGMAFRARGQYEQAAEAFMREVQVAFDPQNLLTWAIATTEVAVVRRLQGRLREAVKICRQAEQRIIDCQALPIGPLARVSASLSEVLREQNQLTEAHQRAAGAIEQAKNWQMPTDQLAYTLTLLRVQLSQRNFTACAETLVQAKALRDAHLVFLDLSRDLDILEIRLALMTGDLFKAERLLDHLQPGTSQIVFVKERELLLLARLYLMRGKPEEALKILSPLIQEAEAAGRGYAVLEITALFAVVLQDIALKNDRGKMREEGDLAEEMLLKALVRAQPEGFVRVFVDEGAPMQTLLEKVRDRLALATDPGKTQMMRYVLELLEAFRPDQEFPLDVRQPEQHIPLLMEPLVEELTERELEVLRLIADGLKYEEIAHRLYISINTVRTYVKAIYSKLNVDNRTKAIAEAHQRKLI